jgi:hypothetical protein
LILVQLNVSDGVGVVQGCWLAGRVKLSVAFLSFLKLFELFQLLVCWLREHIDHGLNLLRNLGSLIVYRL